MHETVDTSQIKYTKHACHTEYVLKLDILLNNDTESKCSPCM